MLRGMLEEPIGINITGAQRVPFGGVIMNDETQNHPVAATTGVKGYKIDPVWWGIGFMIAGFLIVRAVMEG